MKVLRVWLDGASGTQKGTVVDAFPDLEPKEIGTYDDTVLERLDTLMLATHAAGIKVRFNYVPTEQALIWEASC